jgi:hypothetical protein
MRQRSSIPVRTVIYVAAAAAAFFNLAYIASAQNRTANLSGQVTANQGDVRAFRVKARDAAHRISFMVYTENGRYHLYNLPASTKFRSSNPDLNLPSRRSN